MPIFQHEWKMNRLTVFNRQKAKIHAQITRDMEYEMHLELQALWRGIRRKLTRLNRLKIKKSVFYQTDMYGQFQERMYDRLISVLESGLMSLFELETAIWAMRTIEPFTFSYESVLETLRPEIAHLITRTTNYTKRKVAKRVVQWFNTPGEPIKDIVRDLQPTFGLERAHLIAQTEITDLNSRVQQHVASQLGIQTWWWQTKRDHLVCVKPIIGPDGNTYKGCRELHGKRFSITLPMPPKGSHPGCRCDGVLIQEMAKMIKVEFEEDKHPREEDGKFAPKGGGTTGAGVDHTRAYYGKGIERLYDWGVSHVYPRMGTARVNAMGHEDRKAGYTGLYNYLIENATKAERVELARLHTAIRIGEYRERKKAIKPEEAKPKPVMIEEPVADPIAEHKEAHYKSGIEALSKWSDRTGIGDASYIDHLVASASHSEAGYKNVLDHLREYAGRGPERKALEALHTRLRIEEYRGRMKIEGKKPAPRPAKAKIESPEILKFTNDHYEKSWRELAAYVYSRGISHEATREMYNKAKAEPDKKLAYVNFKNALHEKITNREWRLPENEIIDIEEKVLIEYVDGLKALKLPPKPIAVIKPVKEEKPAKGKEPRVIKIPPLDSWNTVLIEKAKTPLYLPSKENKDKVIKYVKNSIQRAEGDIGASGEEAVKIIRDKFKKMLAGKPVSMRVQSGVLDEVLRGDGRFKTQFETGRSRGYLSPETRSDAENKGLGFPSGVENNKRLRPIYGYIAGVGSEASSYGEIELIFKKSVRNRTTVTCGDSLGGFQSHDVAGTPLIKPDIEGIDGSAYDVVRGKLRHEYMEAQIHGGAKISEVETVKFHSNCFRHGALLDAEYADYEKKLKAMGIKVVYDADTY